jgi:predicted ABC-type transport system involved in lysophospholipase L1 biosynthesis ATPase subunit
MSPRVLLADEPTGNLDRATGQTLHELLRRLVGEHRLSVLVVTHNEELARACDRVMRLEGGRLAPA